MDKKSSSRRRTFAREQSFGVVPVYRSRRGARYLLVQHRAGHWGFPKGHVEKGERPIETARRELAEETGIAKCQILSHPLSVETYWYERGGVRVKKHVGYFLGFVFVPRVTIEEDEIRSYRWASYEQAMKIAHFLGTKRLLIKARAILMRKRESSGQTISARPRGHLSLPEK